MSEGGAGEGAQARKRFGRAAEEVGREGCRNVDKSGFMKAAAPIQDQLAKELGPHAVRIRELIRNVK